MKPTKEAISFVLHHEEDPETFVVVQRPADDENLPNVWGLPAGSPHEKESPEDAVYRSAKEKLGIEVEIVSRIGEGTIERDAYFLHMQDYEVRLLEGTPSVPQPYPDVTQYQNWRWGKADDLVEAAQKGSLCTRVYLESVGRTW
jgi:8-oxo-dGTP pyrophosphatase MutT (NUDIX family)